MTTHTVLSTTETIRSGYLDPTAPPVASVVSGDIVDYPDTWTHWGNEATFLPRILQPRSREQRVTVHVEMKAELVGCRTCGLLTAVKDRTVARLVDLSVYGRPTCFVWHKRRRSCPSPSS